MPVRPTEANTACWNSTIHPSPPAARRCASCSPKRASHGRTRRINFQAQEHLSDAYLKLNPNVVAPTLVHHGRPVVDSPVINEYLEDMLPEPRLMPVDPYERARMCAWRQFIDEVPTSAIRIPSFNAFVRHIRSPMIEDDFRDFTGRMPLRKHFYRKMGPEGFRKDDVDEALEKLRATVERAEKSLAAGPWLCGGMFTLADISLTPSIVGPWISTSLTFGRTCHASPTGSGESRRGPRSPRLWRTAAMPSDLGESRDLCSVPTQLAPPKRGSVLRIVEFAPDRAWMKKIDSATAFASMGKSGSAALAHAAGSQRHAMMHATQTVDYAIVLKGEIWAVMDVGETKMKAGDVLIQRGTNHAWSNRSNKPCHVAFILIDAKPRGKKKAAK